MTSVATYRLKMGNVLYRLLLEAMVAKLNMIGGRQPLVGITDDKAWRKVGGGTCESRDLRMITTVMPAIPTFFCAPP